MEQRKFYLAETLYSLGRKNLYRIVRTSTTIHILTVKLISFYVKTDEMIDFKNIETICIMVIIVKMFNNAWFFNDQNVSTVVYA